MIKEITVYYELGKRIKYLRNKRNLTQLELAINCGIEAKYLSDIENGRRNPTLKILNKIALGLHVTLEELFRGINGNYI